MAGYDNNTPCGCKLQAENGGSQQAFGKGVQPPMKSPRKKKEDACEAELGTDRYWDWTGTGSGKELEFLGTEREQGTFLARGWGRIRVSDCPFRKFSPVFSRLPGSPGAPSPGPFCNKNVTLKPLPRTGALLQTKTFIFLQGPVPGPG